jgi:hypothetical protein
MSDSVYSFAEAAAVHCPSCGKPLPDRAVLCIACGYHLQERRTLPSAVADRKRRPSRWGRVCEVGEQLCGGLVAGILGPAVISLGLTAGAAPFVLLGLSMLQGGCFDALGVVFVIPLGLAGGALGAAVGLFIARRWIRHDRYTSFGECLTAAWELWADGWFLWW